MTADAATVAAYRVGWSLVRRLPERTAYALFDRIADLTVRRGGAARMRSNYALVRPELGADELDALVAEGMRRYLRYYCEAFRLPDLAPAGVDRRFSCEGVEHTRGVIEAGGSVVSFLGHLGNWDLAGAWAVRHLRGVTTVAERLKPEAVFEDFLAFREGIGMTILPLTGGGAPFAALREAARRPGLIPLLSDRDLSGSGVEVDFCGERARMAAGPALLALTEKRPLVPISVLHRRMHGTWGIHVVFHDEVPAPATGTTAQKVQAMTQGCADAIGATVRDHTADWHMLQRVFVRDLDGRR